jgi:hypothetical protein
VDAAADVVLHTQGAFDEALPFVVGADSKVAAAVGVANVAVVLEACVAVAVVARIVRPAAVAAEEARRAGAAALEDGKVEAAAEGGDCCGGGWRQYAEQYGDGQKDIGEVDILDYVADFQMEAR